MPNAITRFVIIADARTGSSFLKTLLRSHPEVLSFGEVLNQTKILWDYEDFNDRFNTPQLHAARDADPVAFIKSVYGLAEQGNFSCVGFKSIYNHYQYSRKHRELIPFLLENEDIRIIHLKRMNTFKKFCSMRIAQQRTARGRTMNAYRADDVEHNISITVDPEKCLNFFKKSAKTEAKFDSLFAHRNPLEVRYEELSADTGSVMAGVLNFLDLPPARLSISTHKVRQQPIEEVVTNYAETAQFLTNAGYGDLFTGKYA